MYVHKTRDYDAMCRRAAGIISAQVILKPNSVLGLATGGTPEGIYKILAEGYKNGDVDFANVTSVNLDEYIGLEPSHSQSYRFYMQSNLFDHINIDAKNTHVPNGLEADEATECARYDAVIATAGGIDLQLLGIGHNGHIGFNEPDDNFPLDTHAVQLTESTIRANTRFFDSEAEVPRRAYTMGIGTIMRARHVVLVASGKEKAEIIKKAFYGAITPQIPASILQLHPNFTLICDEAALSLV